MNALFWLLERRFVVWFFETRLVTFVLRIVLRFWELNDRLPYSNVQLIVLISYAALSDRLTNGSRLTATLAKDLARQFPMAKVVGGEFSGNPKGAHELRQKEKLFSAMTSGTFIPVPHTVSSTTDECEAILEVARREGISVNNMIVVCEGSHSRRARIVWKYYLRHLPLAKMYFKSVHASKAADHMNPMIAQRSWQVWLVANILAYPFFKWFPGVRRIAYKNPRQPVSNPA